MNSGLKGSGDGYGGTSQLGGMLYKLNGKLCGRNHGPIQAQLRPRRRSRRKLLSSKQLGHPVACICAKKMSRDLLKRAQMESCKQVATLSSSSRLSSSRWSTLMTSNLFRSIVGARVFNIDI
ncbi:hypothetical protein HAX54_018714 [Datura stramonium]|uniref:Uncharacterized protein n=1 Tax=Datura stramonium TaxID=4076 RepID=A0ABS8UNM0_DATST|nr:hypothetical protein [Datura stramonium]